MYMTEDRENEVFYIGKTNFRNSRIRFGIKRKDRRSHMYIIGKTGTGKSTLIKNLIIQDLKKGNGLALFDPHGDLVEEVRNLVPEERKKDVIYINPLDKKNSVGINILEGIGNSEGKHLIASGLISVFKKLWAEFWGPRTEHIFRNSILTLTEYPGSTLLDLNRLLIDTGFRKTALLYVRDEQVKEFWIKEFEKYPARLRAEAIAPIQNKAGAFLGNPMIRKIVAQKRSSFDLREVIDKRKILLLNLAKGRIGEDSSTLLGSLLAIRIHLAALSRADIPEEEREDFYLYIDEFQNLVTSSLDDMLSESKKFRLSLILAHQYLDQIDRKTVSAIFGNVGSILSFRIGARDAEYLAKEFYPLFRVEDLVHLPAFHIYIKLMLDGVTSKAFSAVTVPSHMEKGSFRRDKMSRSINL